MDEHGIVIAGGGLAAGSAAKTLRAEGWDGPITVVGSEHREPYLRPPLSKEFLLGKATEEETAVNPPGWYDENGVELRLGETVSRIVPASRVAALASGELLHYRALLLATGAQPRTLDLPGSQLEGIVTLRRFEDSLALRSQLDDGGKQVVVVGSGWIGMEVAAAARTYGNEVIVLGRAKTPLGQLEPELGDYFRRLHESEGVGFRLGTHPAEFKASDDHATDNAGCVRSVVTDSGERLSADLVLVAIGVDPDVGLAHDAGLLTGNGVIVDASLRTSAEGVFAAGDVANSVQPFTGDHVRSEHWSNALNGGKVAAKSMLGKPAALDIAPYFYTDQFGLSLEYSGYTQRARGAKLVLRGSIETVDSGLEGFVAFWIRDRQVVAAMNVNTPRSQKALKALIASRAVVDEDRLADPEVPLAELIA
ncbi:NAD(P)/FAD-dependent oxidoreductase [Sinomonas humi]|uniref:Pyridine nucleotide-disulfide oxidoreductase n=1 Tax=Sinomonas humi TaxID=1338436 RepID=A0A0B2AFS6_9MICC|nr:FAD-dependent oxidoreductase [Sinomonas humi]KHL00665.1 pyridine nucleotide-disulfide oxidoreductase [Sinomonas humi]